MAELKERYAYALYELALEKGELEKGLEQAAFVAGELKRSRSEEFLTHPNVPDSAKRELLDSLFSGKISDDLMGFLYLAVKNSHEAIILPALEAFMDMAKRHGGRMVAFVVSPAPLREEQILALRGLLARKLGREVDIQTQVDPALIGGFYVHVGSRLIDLTVRSRLNNMRENLKKGGTE
ncbi:MAG: ATP synthase F1 subunit delta [Oscillospiraceae bacterium]|jgi:F-type H+-transporting ATPase subunit delta